MALQQGQTTSFKVELLQGVHNFTASTGDTFKIALYEASASLGPTTRPSHPVVARTQNQ